MTPQEYQVTIGMAPTTVGALSASGSHLYGLLAVQTSDKATMPVVWLQTDEYGPTTPVSWSGACSAYTALAGFGVGHTVTPNFSVAIQPGQVLTVDQAGGGGEVTAPGPVADAIATLNTTSTPLTAGLCQALDGSSAPICASPLHGNWVDLWVPLPKLLLAFSDRAAAPGSVVGALPGSPALLVDLTDATQRSVTYDVDAGWTWGGFTWGQAVGATASLVPLLVEPSASLSAAVPGIVAAFQEARSVERPLKRLGRPR